MMATTTTLTMSANTINSNEVSGALSYPRTGKRGVPQQFPRRLYTMLQSESSLEDANLDPQKNPLILWSESGQAFRITNIEQFSTHVLPKYFRTSKFSSFQRNLNLYGFSKVRKGPDTDMYAHPSFLKGRPELLSQLKKSRNGATAADKKLKTTNRILTRPASTTSRVVSSDMAHYENMNGQHIMKEGDNLQATATENASLSINCDTINSRVVSPCYSSYYQGSPQSSLSSMTSVRSNPLYNSINSYGNQNTSFLVSRKCSISSSISSSTEEGEHARDLQSYERNVSSIDTSKRDGNSNVTSDSNFKNQGKLGLLALAMECLADRDAVP